jgi:hypothetical protein
MFLIAGPVWFPFHSKRRFLSRPTRRHIPEDDILHIPHGHRVCNAVPIPHEVSVPSQSPTWGADHIVWHGSGQAEYRKVDASMHDKIIFLSVWITSSWSGMACYLYRPATLSLYRTHVVMCFLFLCSVPLHTPLATCDPRASCFVNFSKNLLPVLSKSYVLCLA